MIRWKRYLWKAENKDLVDEEHKLRSSKREQITQVKILSLSGVIIEILKTLEDAGSHYLC